jgi:hypothetical protein
MIRPWGLWGPVLQVRRDKDMPLSKRPIEKLERFILIKSLTTLQLLRSEGKRQRQC